ncbi:ARID DNA-binding domain-containing protein [Tanacetum coccineum]
MLSATPKLLSGIEDSHHGPSDAMHNPPQPFKVRKTLVSKLTRRYTHFYRLFSLLSLVVIEKRVVACVRVLLGSISHSHTLTLTQRSVEGVGRGDLYKDGVECVKESNNNNEEKRKYSYSFFYGSDGEDTDEEDWPQIDDETREMMLLERGPPSYDIRPYNRKAVEEARLLNAFNSTHGCLFRETPKRLFPWNSRKKSLSPESKKILWKKMKEVEAFNASKISAKVKDHGERSARTLKEKRARCYICKIRGHVFWKCPNKKREAMIEQQKKLVKPTVKKIEERVKYPEKVHIITDYMVEGTDDASWDRIWMVGKEETERKFIFSYGVGEVTVDTRDRNLVIPCVLYTPETTLNVIGIDQLEDQGYIVKYNNNKCSLHYMFDEARTKITQEEETKEDDGSENVVLQNT